MKKRIRELADCPHSDYCSAPHCPLQANTLKDCIFYPDEEICQAKEFQTLAWIKNQKAIGKAKAPNDKYFTFKMLQAITQVHKGIVGIDSDLPFEKAQRAEQSWISSKSKKSGP